MSINDGTRPARSGRAWPVLIAALLAIGALALSACGSDDGDDGDSGDDGSSASASGGNSNSDSAEWCGDEPVTLLIQDGGGLNDWSKQSLEQVKIATSQCPAIEEEIVVNAGFDPQKAVSGIQGAVAQGANAAVIIPDAGVCAELPAMRQASQRGVTTVVWGADGCGEIGTDYEDYVDWDVVAAGRLWTEWMAEQMGGKGNLLYLGGPAGNPVDAGEIKGMYEVLEEYPDIKVLDNVTEESWPVTNWDPAEAQKVSSALLAKYPQIDGVIASYGSVAQAAAKAFKAADRPVPPIATLEQNQLACDWADANGSPNEFELATISNRNWLGQLAVRKAVAAVNGVEEPGASIVELPLVEDSTDAELEPVCKPDESPEAYFSNDRAEEQLDEIVYAEAG